MNFLNGMIIKDSSYNTLIVAITTITNKFLNNFFFCITLMKARVELAIWLKHWWFVS